MKVAQSCPTLCDPMDYTIRGILQDYTVHGILQAKILEWVAFPFSRGSSQSRDWTRVSCIVGGFFTSWVTREAHWEIRWRQVREGPEGHSKVAPHSECPGEVLSAPDQDEITCVSLSPAQSDDSWTTVTASDLKEVDVDLKDMWVALGSGLHEESRPDPCYEYIMNSWHTLLKTWILIGGTF